MPFFAQHTNQIKLDYPSTKNNSRIYKKGESKEAKGAGGIDRGGKRMKRGGGKDQA